MVQHCCLYAHPAGDDRVLGGVAEPYRQPQLLLRRLNDGHRLLRMKKGMKATKIDDLKPSWPNGEFQMGAL
jgi:hypothetical protein